jgi:biotin transport system permease protein
MASADRLLGTYRPLGSAIERWPAGAKYLVFAALTIPAFIAQRWWTTLIALALTACLLLAAKLPARRALGVMPGFAVLVLALAAYQIAVEGLWLAHARGQALLGPAAAGFTVGGNLLVALWGSRLVIMTTPAPVLVDALVTLTRPLARFGFPAERFGLMVLVMLRSIPAILAAFAGIRQAAAARGVTGAIGPQTTQLAIRTVAFAQATGDAMTARGLGDG